MKDKNGKEVWEGSLLNHPEYGEGFVHWDIMKCCFYVVVDGGDLDYNMYEISKTELTGNIHDKKQ